MSRIYSKNFMHDDSQNNTRATNSRRRFLYVWIAAVIGILFFVPAIPKLVPTNTHLPFSINTLVLIHILSNVIIVAVFAFAGAALAPRIGFRSNLADNQVGKTVFWIVLKRQFYYGTAIGLAGAIVAYFMAPDFIAYLSIYPILSRLFGSLTEEVAIRWGIMTIIVWILLRIFQHQSETLKNRMIWSGILLSQILFAIAHIPILIHCGITNPIWSVFTIFIVSLPWGWLFWKHGLESAFIAHSSFHAFVAFFVTVKL